MCRGASWLRGPAAARPVVVVAFGLVALVGPAVATAQPRADAQTVTTAAGEQYRAGAIRRWILGPHHRRPVA